MGRRVLVVAETDPADGDHGKLFGLDPNDASGVGLPAFRSVPTLPVAGSVEGEAVYDRSHQQGFVWTKNHWHGLAPNPIRTYPTEAALLADLKTPAGTYATAGDTGNLFISRAGGWGQVGIHEYKTAALLLAATPLTGALGEALDEGSLWEMTAKGWRCLTTREFATTVAVVAWANPGNVVGSAGCNVGDQALDVAHDVTYIRTKTGWRPTSLWEDSEHKIRTATWCINGQEAVASDTGKMFTWLNGHWIEQPIQHFPTTAELMAATPPNGTLAWADDHHNVFARTKGRWQALNTGFYDPTPIGTIAAFASHTMPAGWLHCDGSAIPAVAEYDELRTALGTTTVPDLRGQFLRGAANLTEALLAKTAWTTGMPKAPFVNSTDGVHHHSTTHQKSGMNGGPWEALISYNNVAVPYQTSDNGAHTHTISGGDSETAPDHVKIHWGIKAKFATVLPANQLLINVAPSVANGESLVFDQKAGTWRNKATTYFSTTAPANPLAGWLWYDTSSKLLSLYDGTKWVTAVVKGKEFFEGTLTLGANAATANEIILIKNIDTTNDGYYISLVDTHRAAERSSVALHAFATDATTAAPCVPIHINPTGAHFDYLRFFWKDSTDKYCLSGMVKAGNNGVIYRAGLMSPTGDLSGVQLDGNTIVNTTAGTKISIVPPRTQPLWISDGEEAATAHLHKLDLSGGAKRFGEMNGMVMAAGQHYIARPYLKFGTTDFDFGAIANVFHVFSMCVYESAGIRSIGDDFMTSHKCGFVYANQASYSVKASTTCMFRMRVTHRGGIYWEVWQETFYGSSNDTPMRMEAKYEIGVTGDLTGMGVRCYDASGATQLNSSYTMDIEYM